METKIIPFDLETAKKIQAGEIEGKIKTGNGKDVRIICFDRISTCGYPIVALIEGEKQNEITFSYDMLGVCEFARNYDLVLEVPDNESQEPRFKPFDKVLVRNNDSEAWQSRLYDIYFWDLNLHGTQDNREYKQCIPYEGNEHLIGTTYKPKEE